MNILSKHPYAEANVCHCATVVRLFTDEILYLDSRIVAMESHCTDVRVKCHCCVPVIE